MNTPTPIMDEEIPAIQEFFSRCFEDDNKEPRLLFRLPDGRIAYVDCTIRVILNG